MTSPSPNPARSALPTLASFALFASLAGCSGASSAGTQPGPPTTGQISVAVTPQTASVLLGNTLALSAAVANSTNTSVTWDVSGVTGGNSVLGFISPASVYTTPVVLPTPSTIIITATSAADSSKKATTTITVTSDITVAISPQLSTIELGAQQGFQARIASAGQPSNQILWSLSGPGCVGAACGTVSASGLLTAPQIVPSPSSEVLTATSVADPSRQASAIINIGSNFAFSVNGPSSLLAGTSANFVATLLPASNSNPNTGITWTLSGDTCSGAACGTLSFSASSSTIVYTAPNSAPLGGAIHIRATPIADSSKAISVDVTLQKPVTLLPTSATRAINHRQRFTASVTTFADTTVNWFVNGISGGNSSFGQICIADSNPCQPALSALAGDVDYIAPAAVPSPNPITITVVSEADPTQSASSTVTILAHVSVNVTPSTALIVPTASRLFMAQVFGTSDQDVIWQVSGPACSAAGNPCGAVNAAGVYAAPAVAPSPNSLNITATSSEDTSRSGSAAITITTVPVITSLLPSSISAGGIGGMTLRVQGANFASSSPGPGSTLRIDGAVRPTLCDSTAACSATLSAPDIAFAGNHSVQVQNPNGTLSAAATLVIVGAANNADSILLSPGAPNVTGKDIVVVDLTTSGTSLPVDNVNLNVISLSQFQPTTSSCAIAAGPAVLSRPAQGNSIVHLCAFSVSGLDAAFTYSLSGPGDIAILGKEPVGLGIVHLTLSLPSAAQAGARSMFIENLNQDVTAATGAVEVR